MKQIYSFLALLFISIQSYAQFNGKSLSVQLSATVQESPAQITLHWPNEANDSAYRIAKRQNITDPWTLVGNFSGTTNSYTDTKVSVGSAYEYAVIRFSKNIKHYRGIGGVGYINAGIAVPMTEGRGKMILLVDNDFIPALNNEIAQLVTDLNADGWIVIRHTVKKSDAVTDVKTIIENDYNADPANVKAVFLLGHIPVPYSGGEVFSSGGIDGHTGHAGAWPADVYYADMTGTWTDNTVNVNISDSVKNRNVPGDGKFDQDQLPADIDLEIGRVDFYDMPAFLPLTETQLIKRYLDKDHAFKTRKIIANEKALVHDNFGAVADSFGVHDYTVEEFAASGYKNFAPMFNSSNVSTNDYRSTLSGDSYLWSYGCGGGTPVSAGGIETTSNFVSDSLRTVFTMLFGSWFGDWNMANDLLRAPLAAKGWTLTDCWSGRPDWIFHHMALGANIGYSAWVSENDYSDYYRGALWNNVFFPTDFRVVSAALMGDPSLRMHIVAPPAKIWISPTKTGANVKWNKSSDASVLGYYVYRTTSLDKSWNKLNSSVTTDTTYVDNAGGKGIYYYMVRAVKLQQSGSGTYYNASIGTMDTITLISTGITAEAPAIKTLSIYPNPGTGHFIISWNGDNNNSSLQIQVSDVTGRVIHTQNAESMQNGGLIPLELGKFPAGIYFVKLTSGNDIYEQKILKN